MNITKKHTITTATTSVAGIIMADIRTITTTTTITLSGYIFSHIIIGHIYCFVRTKRDK